MAEAFLAEVATATLSNLLSAAADPLIRAWGFEGDLNNLKRKLRLAQALLSDAMRTTSTLTGSVAGQILLEELSDVVRDAENVLAEVDYSLLHQKIKRHNKVRAKLSSTLRARGLSQKIQKVSASFDEVHRRGNEIGLKPLEKLPADPPVRIPQTPPTVDESEIVGKEGDVSQLVQRLCSCCSSTSSTSSINDLSVLAVVGSGGLGKTTLAQLVFKNERIVEHFGERMWVTVSDQFDTVRILNDMLQSLTRKNHTLTSIQALIKELKDCLVNKRFLLVLDDVWNKQFGAWDTLRSSLKGMNCFGDNKILITTRDSEVAFIMQSCFNHPLLTLSEADSWKLFRQKAFAGGGAEETEALRAIGERLVRRCGGFPLALRVLGGLMYFRKSEPEWMCIENNPWWSTREEVMPSLRISFDHLESSALKCCFAFCSIFPKDYVLAKDMLAQCWMALGFLHDPEGGDMEDKAEVYFNRLVWSSLFHMPKDPRGTSTCEMHDLVHDLAVDVSKKFSASQGGRDASKSIHNAIHLRLFHSTEDEFDVSRLNFKKFQAEFHSAASLRRLYLEGFTIVGDEDGDDAPSLGVLFQSLTSLTRLKIRRIDRLTKFPSDCLQYSTSLEELEITSCPHLVSVPDLGSLTQLRVLEMGPFSADLEEFPWPNSLPASCSDLKVCGWEKLKALPHQIQHLSASLTELTIENFDGLESLPEWLANLSNLETLTLWGCRNLRSMPSVEAMHRLHRLIDLSIHRCPRLKERCRKGRGSEWPKIAHITYVSIH